MYRKYVNIFLVATFSILIFLLSHFTVLIADDFSYKMIFDRFGVSPNRVNGIYDLFYSQFNHYFVQNGRVIVHFIVQLFLIPDNKISFEIANAFVFCLFLFLFFRVQRKDLRSVYPFHLLFFIVFFWFFFPGINQSVLWLSGSVNYLWSTTLILGFLIVHSRLSEGKKLPKTLVSAIILFGFLCGASQELITIPISLSFALFYLFRRASFTKTVSLSVVPFWIGAIFVSLSPGTSLRVQRREVYHFSLDRISKSLSAFFDSYLEMKVVILLILALVFLLIVNRKKFVEIVSQNFVIFFTIFFSLFFIMFLGYNRPRYFFPVSVFSALLIFSIFDSLKFIFRHWLVKSAIIASLFFLCFDFSRSVTELQRYSDRFIVLDKELKGKNTNVFSAIAPAKTRFFVDGLGRLDRLYWLNQSMSKYYKKKELFFLPEELCAFFNGQSIQPPPTFSISVEWGRVKADCNVLEFSKDNYLVIPIRRSQYIETDILECQFYLKEDRPDKSSGVTFGDNAECCKDRSELRVVPCYSIQTKEGAFLYLKNIQPGERGRLMFLRVCHTKENIYNLRGITT